MSLLEIEKLSTVFRTSRGDVTAVDNVSFSLDSGEKVALVGESGAGKSVTGLSILQLIDNPGIIDPESVIRWRGENLKAKSEREMDSIRGKEIAWIPQNPLSALNPTATIGKQLKETMKTHDFGSSHEIHDRAVELLSQVGIADPEESLKSYPHEYSGGMRQRVLIAIAMSCNPDLIIADEPTTALDMITQAQVINVLEEMTELYDTSLLLITHDLGLVKEICDRVMVMYAAEIIEKAEMTRIFEEPLHPYTRALMKCSPNISAEEELISIPGSVPDGGAFPTGCRFHPRCSEVMDECSRLHPELKEKDGQEVACLLYE